MFCTVPISKHNRFVNRILKLGISEQCVKPLTDEQVLYDKFSCGKFLFGRLYDCVCHFVQLVGKNRHCFVAHISGNDKHCQVESVYLLSCFLL